MVSLFQCKYDKQLVNEVKIIKPLLPLSTGKSDHDFVSKTYHIIRMRADHKHLENIEDCNKRFSSVTAAPAPWLIQGQQFSPKKRGSTIQGAKIRKVAFSIASFSKKRRNATNHRKENGIIAFPFFVCLASFQ